MKGIGEFKNIHADADVWVIGSGASMDYIRPDFFDGKVTIGLNLAVINFPKIKYACVYHFNDLKPNILAGIKTIVPQYECGFTGEGKYLADDWMKRVLPTLQNFPNIYRFEHEDFDGQTPAEGKIVVGVSVAISGMAFAQFIGAKNIILCGIDCGMLDAKNNVEKYPAGGNYTIYEKDIIRMAGCLRAQGIAVHSINPFVNFGLEGHKYTRGDENANTSG